MYLQDKAKKKQASKREDKAIEIALKIIRRIQSRQIWQLQRQEQIEDLQKLLKKLEFGFAYGASEYTLEEINQAANQYSESSNLDSLLEEKQFKHLITGVKTPKNKERRVIALALDGTVVYEGGVDSNGNLL
jgi:hypothetical protein